MPPQNRPLPAPAPRLDRRRFVQSLGASALLGLASSAIAADPRDTKPHPTRVRIWCEGTAPKAVYPKDVDGALGEDFRRRKGMSVTLARLDDSDAGLSDAALDATDTLIWWGRLRHDDLPTARAKAIAERVRAGRLGLVALHGSSASKPFREVMGPKWLGVPKSWRDDGRPERVAIERPDHAITRGIKEFVIPKTSMYAEPFDVPEPNEVFCVSSWEGGATFRSGMTWKVDKGRVVYFRPGHDGFPVLFHPGVRQIIANAALWAAPQSPLA